jgi:AraC family transcriptional regulator of adaptative response / methylphosphotriester-DNA alkyltransferase methyltransferase
VTLAVGVDAIRAEARPRTRPATRELRRAIFDDAVEILAMEYSRPVTIEEIARRVATSPRQLQRVFAEVGGLGFRSYLRQIRLSQGADLLARTDLPVTEVARRVGYRDVGQFSKAFRSAYGVSPSRAFRSA